MTKHLLRLGSTGLLLGACAASSAPQTAPRGPARRAEPPATMDGQRTAGDAEQAVVSNPMPGPESRIAPPNEQEGSDEPTAEVRAEAHDEPIQRQPIPLDLASLVPKRLYGWHAAWNKLIPGFAPKKFVLEEVIELPAAVAAPSLDDSESNWSYDMEFVRRHRSLFRPSPDGSLWADIYVASFALGGAQQPLQAQIGDTSYLIFLDPKTGASRIVVVMGISCGFDDAFWRDAKSLIAVGSCIEGETQRPFMMHVDLQRLVLERFDYPDETSSRFDTERYIRLKNPLIRF